VSPLIAGELASRHVVQSLEVALQHLVISRGRAKRHLQAGVVVAAWAVTVLQLARADL
jgi:hypothetical protein